MWSASPGFPAPWKGGTGQRRTSMPPPGTCSYLGYTVRQERGWPARIVPSPSHVEGKTPSLPGEEGTLTGRPSWSPVMRNSGNDAEHCRALRAPTRGAPTIGACIVRHGYTHGGTLRGIIGDAMPYSHMGLRGGNHGWLSPRSRTYGHAPILRIRTPQGRPRAGPTAKKPDT